MDSLIKLERDRLCVRKSPGLGWDVKLYEVPIAWRWTRRGAEKAAADFWRTCTLLAVLPQTSVDTPTEPV